MTNEEYELSEKERKERNKKIIEKYPFLIPRNSWSGKVSENYDYSYVEGFRDGWHDIFMKLCDVILEEYNKWSQETKDKFYIVDAKEKFGEMRVYFSFSNPRIDDALNIATFLSRYTCMQCGKQPRTIFGCHKILETRGWITPICKKCAKKLQIGKCNKRFHKNIFVTERWTDTSRFNKYYLCRNNKDILRAEPIYIKKLADDVIN